MEGAGGEDGWSAPPVQSAPRAVRCQLAWLLCEASLRQVPDVPRMQGVDVTCFLASTPSQSGLVYDALQQQLDPSCQLPAQDSLGPRLVVGTLDTNQGRLRAV